MRTVQSVQAIVLAFFGLCTPFLFFTPSAREQQPPSLQEQHLQPQDVELETIAAGADLVEEIVAPARLLFYDGDALPSWQGDLLTGGLTSVWFTNEHADGEGMSLRPPLR
jgi:glucose/arabinose dehydrogenase